MTAVALTGLLSIAGLSAGALPTGGAVVSLSDTVKTNGTVVSQYPREVVGSAARRSTGDTPASARDAAPGEAPSGEAPASANAGAQGGEPSSGEAPSGEAPASASAGAKGGEPSSGEAPSGEAPASASDETEGASEPSEAGAVDGPPASRAERREGIVRGGAVGGDGLVPLPASPPRTSTRSIRTTPWRGLGMVEVEFGVGGPVGGTAEGRGNVVSGIVGAAIGVRPSRWLALTTGVRVMAHSREERDAIDEFGDPATIVAAGRMVLVDILGARVFLPSWRRVEPFVDVGIGVGDYHRPFGGHRAALQGWAGLGLDIWVAPALTLGATVQYHGFAMSRDEVGHWLRGGLRMGVHW